MRLFFTRIEWDLADFALDDTGFRTAFDPLAVEFGMRWELAYSTVRPAVAIFVSRYQHCLLDLLYRHQIGELRCRIPLIVSNHGDARDLAAFYGIPYHQVSMNSGNKAE